MAAAIPITSGQKTAFPLLPPPPNKNRKFPHQINSHDQEYDTKSKVKSKLGKNKDQHPDNYRVQQ
jgi:hypothetical protein